MYSRDRFEAKLSNAVLCRYPEQIEVLKVQAVELHLEQPPVLPLCNLQLTLFICLSCRTIPIHLHYCFIPSLLKISSILPPATLPALITQLCLTNCCALQIATLYPDNRLTSNMPLKSSSASLFFCSYAVITAADRQISTFLKHISF